jgi:tetratricopeptide (TPR) repeat protein
VEDGVIRALVAAALVAVAAALLAVAWEVRAWQSTLRDDDLRFQVVPLTKGLWREPSGGPAARAARRLLAVDDDLAFRRTEQLFVQIHVGASDYAAETQRLAAFGQAQSTLEQLARSDPSPARRARAANLLGILLFENAGSAQDNAPLLLKQSVEALRRAVRASPDEADAKYNLELLLTALEPQGEKRRDAPEEAGGEGLQGAGLAGPGKGY